MNQYSLVELRCIRCSQMFRTLQANAMLKICLACQSWTPVVKDDDLPPRIPKANP